MTSRLRTGRRWRRLATSGLLPRRSRCDDGLHAARQFDEARPDRDGPVIRQRDDRDSDLPAVPQHAQPIDDDAASGDRHQRRGAEAAEEARPAEDGAVVQAVDRDAVVSAVEVLAREAEAAEVGAVRDQGARLVEDARALRAELVKEQIATAVAGDTRIERMRQKHLAPERHITEVESGRRALLLGQDVA